MIGAEQRAVRRPWLPGCLSKHGLETPDVERLSYIVIDELIGGVAGLTIWAWPAADGAGRLRFEHPDDALELAVEASKLTKELYRKARIKREPRVGDVFAGAVPEEARRLVVEHEDMLWTQPLAALLGATVYDISLEARKVAKLAHFSAHSPIIGHQDAERWELTDPDEVPEQKAPVARLRAAGGA